MAKTDYAQTALSDTIHRHALTGASKAGAVLDARRRADEVLGEARDLLANAAKQLEGGAGRYFASMADGECRLTITVMGGISLDPPAEISLEATLDGGVSVVAFGVETVLRRDDVSFRRIDDLLANALTKFLSNGPDPKSVRERQQPF